VTRFDSQGAIRDDYSGTSPVKHGTTLDSVCIAQTEGREILTAVDTSVRRHAWRESEIPAPGGLAQGVSPKRLLRIAAIAGGLRDQRFFFGGEGAYKTAAFDFPCPGMGGFSSVNGTRTGNLLRSGLRSVTSVRGLYAADGDHARCRREGDGKGEVSRSPHQSHGQLLRLYRDQLFRDRSYAAA